MSRYRDGDYDDDPEAVLAYGRWAHNARQVLRSKRGRKALAEIREALLALPERRLISGAMCTVGTVDVRLPEITDADVERDADESREYIRSSGWTPRDLDGYLEERARNLRYERQAEREALAGKQAEQGCGVCVNGALLWYRKVRDGMDPDEAFASLPILIDGEDGGDPLAETAGLAEKEAGIAYTLAWQLAYRNDETYELKTPEERWTAFMEWIDGLLAESAAA